MFRFDSITPDPRRGRRAAAVLVAATVLAACGDDGNDVPLAAPVGDGTRTIEVSMTEMSFSPDSVDVEVGDTVTFVFRNDGVVRHEAVLGDEEIQEAHGAEMAEMGGHGDEESDEHGDEMTGEMDDMADSDEHGDEMTGEMDDMADMADSDEHGDGMTDVRAVVLEPGETAEMTVTFDTAGALSFGCHQPGHWEAGMRLDIDV